VEGDAVEGDAVEGDAVEGDAARGDTCDVSGVGRSAKVKIVTASVYKTSFHHNEEALASRR